MCIIEEILSKMFKLENLFKGKRDISEEYAGLKLCFPIISEIMFLYIYIFYCISPKVMNEGTDYQIQDSILQKRSRYQNADVRQLFAYILEENVLLSVLPYAL